MKKKRGAREFVDYDYQDKLPADEREWLKNFTQAEYFNDHKALSKITKATKKEKTRLTRQDHARRRDLMSVGHRLNGMAASTDQRTPEKITFAKEDLRVSVSRPRIEQETKKKKKRRAR